MDFSDQAPIRPSLVPGWEHYSLFKAVLEALKALPSYFTTATFIEGIQATDIFTLNSALGATIESQVVASLNRMRHVWDPDEEYSLYSFVRQAQRFPDVLFRRTGSTGPEDVLFGIELKGWYLLAKEREPSLRFKVSPMACADPDLVCVVPWSLKNVLSGAPQIFSPFVESAKYAAEFRNYHWQCVRESQFTKTVRLASGVAPYPAKTDQISDNAERDPGNNFGRLARTGIMDSYLEVARSTELCGIPAQNWLQFFTLFRDQESTEIIVEKIEGLRRRLGNSVSPNDPISLILDQCERIALANGIDP